MIRLSFAAIASALVLAACATQTDPVETPTATVVVPSQYDLGMSTAECAHGYPAAHAVGG